MPARESGAPVDSIVVSSCTIPTGRPESDGTLAWTVTTLLLVGVSGGGHEGLGRGYAGCAAAHVIHDTLAPLLDRPGLGIAFKEQDARCFKNA